MFEWRYIQRVHLLAGTVCAVPGLVPAQNGWERLLSPQGTGQYTMSFVALAVLSFFLVVMVGLIWRKVRRGRGIDDTVTMSLDDLSGLKQRGMLTEDEARRVRMAISRQVARKVESGSGPKRSVQDLLHDPEVRRLETLARSKSSMAIDVADLVPPPAAPSPIESSAAPAVSASAAAPWAGLPPDVLKMAELGLITEEELAVIRERMRAKKEAVLQSLGAAALNSPVQADPPQPQADLSRLLDELTGGPDVPAALAAAEDPFEGLGSTGGAADAGERTTPPESL